MDVQLPPLLHYLPLKVSVESTARCGSFTIARPHAVDERHADPRAAALGLDATQDSTPPNSPGPIPRPRRRRTPGPPGPTGWTGPAGCPAVMARGHRRKLQEQCRYSSTWRPRPGTRSPGSFLFERRTRPLRVLRIRDGRPLPAGGRAGPHDRRLKTVEYNSQGGRFGHRPPEIRPQLGRGHQRARLECWPAPSSATTERPAA